MVEINKVLVIPRQKQYGSASMYKRFAHMVNPEKPDVTLCGKKCDGWEITPSSSWSLHEKKYIENEPSCKVCLKIYQKMFQGEKI